VLAGDTLVTYTSAAERAPMKEFAPVRAWQVLSESILIAQHWLEVREQRVRLANGHEIERFHLVRGPNWAAVLCLTEAGEVVFVRQYRHGLGGPSLELPAGVLDAGEDPLAAARRELMEETGFRAAEIEPLLALAPEPARNSARAHFFFARGGERVSSQALDHGEDLEVLLVPASEVLSLIESGHIVHAAHIAAILLAMRRGLL
jgi:8-oxo-dGTP pyrophosphatase MutT (NUDIX family)